jgi:predicted RNA binding protein YcfA (HicA-like mRNA interferase family)
VADAPNYRYDRAPLDRFPSMRWPRLRGILTRDPLNYRITRQAGSHRTLEADGRPTLHLAFHDRQDLPGGMVRKILVQDVGLTEDEAKALL